MNDRLIYTLGLWTMLLFIGCQQPSTEADSTPMYDSYPAPMEDTVYDLLDGYFACYQATTFGTDCSLVCKLQECWYEECEQEHYITHICYVSNHDELLGFSRVGLYFAWLDDDCSEGVSIHDLEVDLNGYCTIPVGPVRYEQNTDNNDVHRGIVCMQISSRLVTEMKPVSFRVKIYDQKTGRYYVTKRCEITFEYNSETGFYRTIYNTK